jgi:hypothetical protein
MANWNKLDASFELIQLELEAVSKSEMWYRSTISTTVEELQGAVNNITNHIQLLSASLGTSVDNPKDRLSSLWEAIGALWTATHRIDGVSDGNYIYLDDLHKQLPNWGKMLEQLSLNYFKSLPKMNSAWLGAASGWTCYIEGLVPPLY